MVSEGCRERSMILRSPSTARWGWDIEPQSMTATGSVPPPVRKTEQAPSPTAATRRPNKLFPFFGSGSICIELGGALSVGS